MVFDWRWIIREERNMNESNFLGSYTTSTWAVILHFCGLEEDMSLTAALQFDWRWIIHTERRESAFFPGVLVF